MTVERLEAIVEGRLGHHEANVGAGALAPRGVGDVVARPVEGPILAWREG